MVRKPAQNSSRRILASYHQRRDSHMLLFTRKTTQKLSPKVREVGRVMSPGVDALCCVAEVLVLRLACALIVLDEPLDEVIDPEAVAPEAEDYSCKLDASEEVLYPGGVLPVL